MVLRIFHAAYGMGRPLSRLVIAAIDAFLSRYERHPSFRQDRLVSVLGKMDLTTGPEVPSMQHAMGIKSTTYAAVAVLASRFNKGQLEERRLPFDVHS